MNPAHIVSCEPDIEEAKWCILIISTGHEYTIKLTPEQVEGKAIEFYRDSIVEKLYIRKKGNS